jgi:hypothetical protein
MTFVSKAVLYGFLIWLIPFVVAFVIFPLRETARPLFESIMPVTVTAATMGFGISYFRRVSGQYVKEGVTVGVLWLAICVIIDAPLMLLGGPMRMTLGQYAADIGLTYLIIPTVTVGIGLLLAQRGGTS